MITAAAFQGLYIGSTHTSGVYTLQFNAAVQLIEILVVAASQSPTYSESFTNFTADSTGLLTPTFTNLQGGAAFDGTTVTGAVGDYWFRLRFTADPGDSFTTLSFAHNQTGITYGSGSER